MAVTIIDIKCPSCGGAVDTGQKTCKFCGNPVIISTFANVKDMPMDVIDKYADVYRKNLSVSPEHAVLNYSLAMCYLKLKLYDKALGAFEKAMEDDFNNSEIFFYAAICLLKGKKAFLTPRNTIDKIEEYINAALMIEPKGIYYYFWSYIKYDYFNRKFYNTSPTYQEALEMADTAGVKVSSFDKDELFWILGVSRPETL